MSKIKRIPVSEVVEDKSGMSIFLFNTDCFRLLGIMWKKYVEYTFDISTNEMVFEYE